MNYRKLNLHCTDDSVFVVSSHRLDQYQNEAKISSYPLHALTRTTALTENIFATGLSNGTVMIYDLSKKFEMIKAISGTPRPISTVDLNGKLVIAFERSRNEPSVVVSTYDGLKEFEFGISDHCCSAAWRDASVIISGLNNKFVRIYDTRKDDPAVTYSTKACFGIQKDPFCDFGFMSRNDDAIKIWDIRNPLQEVYSLNFRNCVKMDYSKSRSSIVGALSKDTKSMKFWDIHRVDNEPILKLYQSYEEKHKNSTILSFSFGVSKISSKHPLFICEKKLSLANEYELVQKISWDQEPLVCSFKSSQAICPTSMTKFLIENEIKDIQLVMKERAVSGYGPSAMINARIMNKENDIGMYSHPIFGSSDSQVVHFWNWMAYLSSMKDLDEFKYINSGLIGMMQSSQDANDEELTLLDAPFDNIITSSVRLRALLFLGYPDTETLFSKSLEELVDHGRIAEAAARYFFASDLYSCTNCLINSNDSNLQLIGTVILGYSLKSPASANLKVLADRASCPFLKAMLIFLYEFNWIPVLDIPNLPLVDKIYIAMRYLDNESLNLYLKRETELKIQQGSLFGLFLTGTSSEDAFRLFQNYVDYTGDLQTVVLACLQVDSIPSSHLDICKSWIEKYRSFLNKWELYDQRASFDIIYGAKYPESVKASKVHLKCQFCGLSLLSTNQFMRNTSRFFGQRQQQVGHPIRFGACSNCGQSLPLCSLCSLPVDTNSMGLSTDQFYVWCQLCICLII
eukprot:NODE_8_length_66115_cov_0.981823.p4 type:complete len:741 gc:universal NODE_8_length_66115_cov_0.981823:41474-39252(-)